MGLIKEIRSSLILPELAATGKKEVLQELAAAIRMVYPALETAALYAALLEREELGSTGIGEGIAIPHGKIRGLDDIVICFGRSLRGIAFDALDGKPTHLFFLLVAPEDAAARYLSSLAELSRFLKNMPIRSRLLQAAGKEELLAIFTEAG
ncbi:PTS sugar transporter subunit IIA [Thiovibrio sp. JS02]